MCSWVRTFDAREGSGKKNTPKKTSIRNRATAASITQLRKAGVGASTSQSRKEGGLEKGEIPGRRAP